MCWLFPGRTVRIDAPCLDCGEPMVIEMRDGQFLTIDPPEIVGHARNPWSLMADRQNLPFM